MDCLELKVGYVEDIFFLVQGFSLALECVLKEALVDQAGLKLHLPLPPKCWN